MINPYSEEERLQAMVSACYRASRAHFSHLPIRHIISPPIDMLDAALARQVAIYILHTEFDVPRRRIVKTLGIVRATMNRAIQIIDGRLAEPVFERSYARMSARAQDFFMAALHDAADQEAAA
ncbi:MAG: hypothetical protein ACOH2J_18220 [Allorhizobium sp.]